jgi:hypothetical protein
MAYRGVMMLDDGSIFRAFLRRSASGARSACTRNGDVIDVLVRRALAEGTRPEVAR